MATATPISRHLQIQCQVGTASNGRPQLRSHNYAHVSPKASDDDVLAVGQALGNLFGDPVFQVARVDQTGLA
ncbi:MAG: DUF1659 domain-containing protein [Alicyclobacillaceae bacterium]|nr:DUF1659 domain-containing protein [Alicyclobacillaceae bacterium]